MTKQTRDLYLEQIGRKAGLIKPPKTPRAATPPREPGALWAGAIERLKQEAR